MNSPITGITKNPTIPASPPISSVRSGTPTLLSRRPGTTYLATWLLAATTVAAPARPQPSAPPSTTPQTATAAHTRSRPGSIGTITPAMPTTIASPTSSSPQGSMPVSVHARWCCQRPT